MKLFPRRRPAPVLASAQDRSFTFQNNTYGLGQTLVSTGPIDRPTGYADTAWAYRSHPVVFAVSEVRRAAFSEARFQYRRMQNGRPGPYFGDTSLLPLEVPWERGSTGDLLSVAISDLDLSGNFYAVRNGPGDHPPAPGLGGHSVRLSEW